MQPPEKKMVETAVWDMHIYILSIKSSIHWQTIVSATSCIKYEKFVVCAIFDVFGVSIESTQWARGKCGNETLYADLLSGPYKSVMYWIMESTFSVLFLFCKASVLWIFLYSWTQNQKYDFTSFFCHTNVGATTRFNVSYYLCAWAGL